MKKSITIFLAFLFCQATTSFAQDYYDEAKGRSPFYLGIGTGLDYGGIGIKFEYQPIKWVAAIAGVGFNFHSYGVNFGASFYPLPDKKLQPLVTLLYGYNAAIVVQGMSKLNKTYYGISPGIGGILKTGKRGNTVYLALFHPFRNQAFHDDYEALKVNPMIDVNKELLPVTISVGFNWAL